MSYFLVGSLLGKTKKIKVDLECDAKGGVLQFGKKIKVCSEGTEKKRENSIVGLGQLLKNGTMTWKFTTNTNEANMSKSDAESSWGTFEKDRLWQWVHNQVKEKK